MNRAWVWIRGQFWALPMLCAIVAAVLGLTLSELDDSLDTSSTLPFLFAGGPEGARALLSAIVASMISFTGLVHWGSRLGTNPAPTARDAERSVRRRATGASTSVESSALTPRCGAAIRLPHRRAGAIRHRAALR